MTDRDILDASPPAAADTADETRQGRIHRALRAMILSGDLAPGQRLREAELSARFRSSRAPVREAIRRLESEGLVRSDFWRGSRVAQYSARELHDLYALRGLIEGYAAAQLTAPLPDAAQTRMAGHLAAMIEAAAADDWLGVALHDTRWHREIMLAAGLPTLLTAWDGANGPLQMTFGQVGGAFYGRDDIRDRHHSVLAALGGPAPRTEATIRHHYMQTAERLLATVADPGDPATPAAPDRANPAPSVPDSPPPPTGGPS
ncbi:MAG: GntR family transcriptional regulator [Alkalilacustris sp.]